MCSAFGARQIFGEVPGDHDYFGCFNGAMFVFVGNTIATGVVGVSMTAAERTLAAVLRTSFRFVCRLLLGGGARQILLGVVPLAGHCTPVTASFQLVLGRRVARCCTIGCDQEDTFQQRFTNRPGADEFAAVARPLVPGTSECWDAGARHRSVN